LIPTSGETTVYSKPIVVGLTACQRESDRQAIGIDQRMDFAGQPAPGSSHGLLPVPDDGCTVLMHADNRCIDHLDSCIMGTSERIYDTAPHPGPPPANEAIVASGVGANASDRSRQGAPERRTQKMPLRTRRSFTRGTPRGLSGNIGLMAVHSWSESW